MTQTRAYVVLDLGAESGRVAAGRFDGARLQVRVVHRFLNQPVRVGDSLYWDVLHLWSQMRDGLSRTVRAFPFPSSVGVDAWALDFGLLGADGALLGNPHHYRDARTRGMIEEVFRHVSEQELYQATGNTLTFPTATICQLMAMVKERSPILQVAESLLWIADLFGFWFTGRKASETSQVVNTRCYDPRAKGWAIDILQKLGIPTHIFPDTIEPGSILGTVLPSVARETGCGRIPVVTPACHDSAAAVVGAPIMERDRLFLSCGTWSVLGTEIDEPHISPDGPPDGLWNEGGVQGNFRFTSNVMGLWLLQECRRQWSAEGESYSYSELTELACEGRALASLIDPNAPCFLLSGDMPGRVRAFCAGSGQPVPESKADIVRCILESLALKYRQGKEAIEGALNRKMKAVHMVGGGSQNRLLCQFTANALNLPVKAGPTEATAMGNAIMQAIGLGHLASVQEGRQLVRDSVPISVFGPDQGASEAWEEAYERFLCYRAPREF
jgi:rhamnulokinase